MNVLVFFANILDAGLDKDEKQKNKKSFNFTVEASPPLEHFLFTFSCCQVGGRFLSEQKNKRREENEEKYYC
jgi:hypothetical protein